MFDNDVADGRTEQGAEQRAEQGAGIDHLPSPSPQVVAVEALTERAREVAAQVGVLQAELVGLVQDMEAAGGPVDATLRQWVAWQCGLTPAEAGRTVELADRLTELPLLTEVLASGERSEGAVLALARVATPDTEAELLDACEAATAGQLQVLARRYRRASRVADPPPVESRARTWHDDDTRTQRLTAHLDDLDGARLEQALRRAHDDLVAQWRHDTAAAREAGIDDDLIAPRPTLADALLHLADAYVDPSAMRHPATPRRTELHADLQPGPDRHRVPLHDPADARRIARERYHTVLETEAATLDALAAAAHGHRPDGPTLADPLFAEACCESVAQVLLTTAGGTPLWLTSPARNATPAQRRALAARDLTCRAPGCGATHRLIPHHVDPHAEGGPTRLDNLVLLCAWHHRLVHRRGHRIEPDGLGGWRWYDHHGRWRSHHPDRSPPDPLPDVRAVTARASGSHEPLTHWAADTIIARWLT